MARKKTMERRTFLKRGLAGGALLAAGGLGLAAFPGRISYRPTQPLLSFNEKQFNVLAAVAARVVTAAGADPVAIAHTADQAVHRAVPEAQADLRKLLDTLESGLVGLLLDARPQPFSRLTERAQHAALLEWRDSMIELRRGGYKVLKNLCASSYYRKEETWPQVGYPGPPPIGVAAQVGTP